MDYLTFIPAYIESIFVTIVTLRHDFLFGIKMRIDKGLFTYLN
jgi:hypothetical protein